MTSAVATSNGRMTIPVIVRDPFGFARVSSAGPDPRASAR